MNVKRIFSQNRRISLIGIVVFLALPVWMFAAPPGSKFFPGETPDPTCMPGDTNCSVELSEVERGTGAPASTPTGADPIVYIDEATGDAYSWDGAAWNQIGGSPYELYFENPVVGFTPSIATGDNAIALGDLNEATGDWAFAMGILARASGDESVSLGSETTASGWRSFAINRQTTASGTNTFAAGVGTLAKGYSEFAIGTYNTNYTPVGVGLPDPLDRLFVIGNGSSSGSRSDAFTVLTNGKVGIGYDNFETTASSAMLQVNGDLLVDGSDFEINGVNYTFPGADGTGGDFLSTDGSGILSWVTPDTGFTFDVDTSNMWVPIENSGSAFTTGYENLFIGVAAGEHTTQGYNNTFIGYRAGRANTTGHGVTALGSNAGSGNTIGNDNLYFGSYAGNGTSTSSGSIMIGNNAGIVSNAGNNLFLGHYAGNNNTSGAGNIFVGNNAGLGNNTGVNNTLVGFIADVSGGTVSNSTGIGKEVVLYSDNQFVAGSPNTPMLDVVFGQGDRSSSTQAYTIRGTNGSGSDIPAGNIILAGGKATGNAAGGDIVFQTSNAGGSGTTLQSYTTKMILNELGDLGLGDSTPDFRLDVENAATSGIVASFTTADGTCTLDVSDVTGFSCPSDRNLKKDIQDIDSTINQIRELRPVTYRLKNESNSVDVSSGFIAQEVEDVFPKLIKHQKDGTLAMNYGGLITPLIKAFQELDEQVSEFKSDVMAIAGSFASNLRSFLASAENGIEVLFAKKVQTSELCLDDVCITKEELQNLLANQLPQSPSNSDDDSGVPQDENDSDTPSNGETGDDMPQVDPEPEVPQEEPSPETLSDSEPSPEPSADAPTETPAE